MAASVLLLQWRYGFNWGDEGWLWYISQRTAHGEVPIRDIFSYDPGRYYWSAAVFKLLGNDGLFEQLVANYLFGAIALAAAYLAMARARIRAGWRGAALLLLGIGVGFPRHKIFEQSLSLIAAAGIGYVLSEPEKRMRWFLYGIATGMAAFFGRNSGLYFFVAAILAYGFLRWSSRAPRFRPPAAALLAGIVIGYSPVFAMMLRFRGFTSAFLDSVLLTPNWSWPLRIPFPWHSHVHGLDGFDALQVRSVSWLCLAIPAVYVVSIWKAAREKQFGSLRLAGAASLAGIPYLHHAFYHADFFHIAQAVLPFAVATAGLSQYMYEAGHPRWSLAFLGGISALALACWLPMEPGISYLRASAGDRATVSAISIGGRTFEIPAEQADIMTKTKAAFQACGGKAGSFLEAPFYPGLYAYLNTRAPSWDTYYLWPRDSQIQQQQVQALVANRTALVLLNRTALFDRQDWLRIDRTYPSLVEYILAHYQRSDVSLPDGFELYFSPQRCGFAETQGLDIR